MILNKYIATVRFTSPDEAAEAENLLSVCLDNVPASMNVYDLHLEVEEEDVEELQ